MNVAMYYLGRFAASSSMLRTVLMRRVDRAVRAELIERGDGAAMVDTVTPPMPPGPPPRLCCAKASRPAASASF